MSIGISGWCRIAKNSSLIFVTIISADITHVDKPKANLKTVQ